jgi:hypothetical protein
MRQLDVGDARPLVAEFELHAAAGAVLHDRDDGLAASAVLDACCARARSPR